MNTRLRRMNSHFKNVPEQFVQMGNDQLSLTFKLSMTDGKEVVLPNKKVVEDLKKAISSDLGSPSVCL